MYVYDNGFVRYGDYLGGDLNMLVINIYLSTLKVCKSDPSIINTITSILYFFKTTFKDYYSLKPEVCTYTIPQDTP